MIDPVKRLRDMATRMNLDSDWKDAFRFAASALEAEMKGEAPCQHTRTRRHMQPAATSDRTCLDCGLMLTTPAKPEPVASQTLVLCQMCGAWTISATRGFQGHKSQCPKQRGSGGSYEPEVWYSAPPDTVPRVDYECAMELARGRVPREEYEALRDALIEASDHLHESYSKAMSRGCTDFDPCPVDIRSESALRHADEVLGRKP